MNALPCFVIAFFFAVVAIRALLSGMDSCIVLMGAFTPSVS